MDPILHSLAASGPIALVLAVAVWQLWVRDRRRELEHAKRVSELEGRLDAKDVAHNERVDLLHQHCEERVASVVLDTRSAFREIAQAVRENWGKP